MEGAIDDAGLQAGDIGYVNAHGTSTPKGDATEIECLRTVFGKQAASLAVSSNKSQIGHTLGASAAIEAALSIEAQHKGLILPTINHIPDPDLADVDVVPNEARNHRYEFFMSNAFGFGGTNCCVVFKGV
jgi:3-oxoacyl-[acyl-carrier-protein] synthase II